MVAMNSRMLCSVVSSVVLAGAMLTVAGIAGQVQAVAAPRSLSVGACAKGGYPTIQSAIDAAHSGDTISVCPGTYVEGSGSPGTDALTITKSLDLVGAGAAQVTVEPRNNGGRIAEQSPDIRSGKGVLV